MILVAGEALFDLFLDDPTAPPEARRLRFNAAAGGSPLNVATGLARLGAPVGFLGGLSTDPLGRRLAAVLAAEGVSLAHTLRSERPSTVSFVDVDAHGAPDYAILANGAADLSLAIERLPVDFDGVDALHVCSYPLVVPPISVALDALTTREAGRRLIALDPNVRVMVEPDLDLWRGRIDAHAARADVVKLSDEDCAHLHPDLDAAAVAQRYRALGAGLVIVTQGAKGASAWSAAGAATAQSPMVDVIDTVGAGDAFQAATLAHLRAVGALRPGAPAALDDDALARLLHVATTAAALTCARHGAEPPTCDAVQRALAPPPSD